MLYHKIQTIYKRDMADKGRLMPGKWTLPVFEYLANNPWTATEKIDGTNIRVMWDGEKVEFGGRTERAQIPAHLIARLMERFPVDKFKALDYPAMTLCGEGYGHKIQKSGNLYSPTRCDFILFDVHCGDVWLERDGVNDIAEKCEIDSVPTLSAPMTLHDAVAYVMEARPSAIGDAPLEGLVVRPVVELCDRQGHRIIAKIKTHDFTR